MFNELEKNMLEAQNLALAGAGTVDRLRSTVVSKVIRLVESSISEFYKPLTERIVRQGYETNVIEPCPKIRQLLEQRYPWADEVEVVAIQCIIEGLTTIQGLSSNDATIEADGKLAVVQSNFEVLDGLGSAGSRAKAKKNSLIAQAVTQVDPLCLVLYERFLRWYMETLPKRSKERTQIQRRIELIDQAWGQRLSRAFPDALDRPKKPGRPKKLPPAKDLFLERYLSTAEEAAEHNRKKMSRSALILLYKRLA